MTYTIPEKIFKFNQDLLPELVKVKYENMYGYMYRFFRGTCHLYYDALHKEKNLPASPLSWICGDLHMENFGSYKGDNRLVYFDLNDFDEAILAPASWELIRFISSIFIAFDYAGIEEQKALNMSKVFLKTYSQTLANGKSFYIEPQTARGIICSFLNSVAKRKQKDMLKKRTVRKHHRRILKTDKKRLPIDKTLKNELRTHITEWVEKNSGRPYNFEVVDVVFRVAGLGSLGLKRYLLLLKSTNVKEQYLLVDMKESRKSSLLHYSKIPQPKWKTESERIIAIQERMQNIPPALLSTTVFKGDSYVLQELQPTKDSINLDLIKDRYRDIYQVIDDMAMLTASAQLRSAGRQGSATADELIAFGRDETWQDALILYAMKYTKKVKEDHVLFREAYEQMKHADDKKQAAHKTR